MIGDPGYYDGPAHDAVEIRNQCSEIRHTHVMRPFGYDAKLWPGNYGGLIVWCENNLEEGVARTIAYLYADAHG